MALLSHFSRKSRIIINPKDILSTHHDPDSKERYSLRKIGRNNEEMLPLEPKRLFLVLALSLLPISVSAGLVGAISGIFLRAPDEEIPKNKNVQNMTLLAAISTPFIDNQINHAPIIEDNAIVPEGDGPISPVSLIHKNTSDQISIYVVRKGDTLSQIAEMFDVSVNTIKWGNNLSSNTLKEGDNLVILPISGVKHTVVKGDTLASLAKKYKGDVEEIEAYNNIENGAALTLGSTVIIPDGEVLHSQSTSNSPRVLSGLKEYVGYYLRPIVGGRKTQGIHGYNGIDIGAPLGTKILAAASGEVIISRSGGWNGGYGNYVVIKHENGTQTLYSHNNSNNVSVGEKVSQGDVIGFVGRSGKATGPHLHFEIRGAKNPF